MDDSSDLDAHLRLGHSPSQWMWMTESNRVAHPTREWVHWFPSARLSYEDESPTSSRAAGAQIDGKLISFDGPEYRRSACYDAWVVRTTLFANALTSVIEPCPVCLLLWRGRA